MPFTHWASKIVSAAELRKVSTKLAPSSRFYFYRQFYFCNKKRKKQGEDLLPILLVCVCQRGSTMAVASMVALVWMMAMVTIVSTMLRCGHDASENFTPALIGSTGDEFGRIGKDLLCNAQF